MVRFAIAAQRLLSGDAQPRSHQAGTCVRRLSRLAPTSGAELRLGGEPERNLSYIAKRLRGRAAWPPLRLSADFRDVRCTLLMACAPTNIGVTKGSGAWATIWALAE